MPRWTIPGWIPAELYHLGQAAPDVYICERCGGEMVEHHCKIRCPNCGYIRDCSDPRAPMTPGGGAAWKFNIQ